MSKHDRAQERPPFLPVPQLRWQRAHHIERIPSPESIFTDDVLVFLWRFKELTILPLWFLANIKSALYGTALCQRVSHARFRISVFSRHTRLLQCYAFF